MAGSGFRARRHRSNAGVPRPLKKVWEFKARVAIAGQLGETTLAEPSSEFGVDPTTVGIWKQDLTNLANRD